MDMIANIIGTVSLIWQLGVALMGRTAVIAKPSVTCDVSFHEFNRAPYRNWWVCIYISPPNDVIIRNAEGKKYRFEASLARLNYGGLTASITWTEGWNEGEKDKRHKSPIILTHEGDISSMWISQMTSDWFIEVWITIGSKRRKTLYKGHPTGAINITKDK
jgi:hypothetical protein